MDLVKDNDADMTMAYMVLTMNGVRYTIETVGEASVSEHLRSSLSNAALFIVIDVGQWPSQISNDLLQTQIKLYGETDDAFQVQFLQDILFSRSRIDQVLSP